MRNVILLVIICLLSVSCCSYLNKRLGLQDDNLLEEVAEEVLHYETGISIDFTPSSSE